MILFVGDNSGILFIKLSDALILLGDFVKVQYVRFKEYVQTITKHEDYYD